MEAFVVALDELVGAGFGAGELGEVEEVLMNVGDGVRGHPEDFGFVGEGGEGAVDFVAGGGADLAEVLGEDDGGGEFAEELFVEGVEALAGAELGADGDVDFAERHGFDGKCAVDDDGFVADFGRVIAFVGDADDVVSQAERAGEFGGGGEEGDDAELVHARWSFGK